MNRTTKTLIATGVAAGLALAAATTGTASAAPMKDYSGQRR